MVKVYTFLVIDRQFHEEYLYTGWFETTDEAVRFMAENRADGNSIRPTGFRFSSTESEEYKAFFR